MQLAHDKIVPVDGLNYKDAPDDAAEWLNRIGDPYIQTGADRDGRVAIDWGVYEVPETFVVGADGIIVYKQMGALIQEALAETILPLERFGLRADVRAWALHDANDREGRDGAKERFGGEFFVPPELGG